MTDDAYESMGPSTLQSIESPLRDSESTAFHMWLLITISSGLIMAQDTWLSLRQPRLGTMDATASFTKVIVIHALWFLVSLGFLVFSWKIRPTSAWRVHIVASVLAIAWTAGVLVNAFAGAETLRVSTWRCTTMPSEETTTAAFLDTCDLTDSGSSIRMGGDIFLWSIDDKNYWRWIVSGKNMVTLQTRWPSDVSAMYLAREGTDMPLVAGSSESVPGGTWSAAFDPGRDRNLHVYYIDSAASPPEEIGTPQPHEIQRPADGGS
jgi:hypothetical protein